jgi:hypothetical protein
MGLLDKAKARLAAIQQGKVEARAAATALALRQQDYRGVLATMAWLDMDDAAFAELAALRADAALRPADAAEVEGGAFLRCFEEALDDDILSSREEDRLVTLMDALGVDINDGDERWAAVRSRLIVARANDGRLQEIDPSEVSIMLKPREVAHHVVAAVLLKQVAKKEWQSGSHGVSFRVAKGVRYNVGRSRGRMVTVGSEVVAEDSGQLWVTNQRTVFRGDRKVIEFAHGKLLDVRVYDDGVGLAVSGRQATSTFRTPGATGDATAAVLNMAAQRLL